MYISLKQAINKKLQQMGITLDISGEWKAHNLLVDTFYDFDKHSEIEFGLKAEDVEFNDTYIVNCDAFIGYNYKF